MINVFTTSIGLQIVVATNPAPTEEMNCVIPSDCMRRLMTSAGLPAIPPRKPAAEDMAIRLRKERFVPVLLGVWVGAKRFLRSS
jgi:hypothetical protein